MSEPSADLDRELHWLAALIETRLKLYFSECQYPEVRDLAPPDLSRSFSAYAQTVLEHSASFEERAILALALAPHLRPQVLDSFLIRNAALDRVFTEFGGARLERKAFGPLWRQRLLCWRAPILTGGWRCNSCLRPATSFAIRESCYWRRCSPATASFLRRSAWPPNASCT